MKKELNTAVLLITHDMGVISEMADNVIVMYAGKIVEYTNVEDLFKNPLHPYTIGLRRSIPDIDSDDQEELEVIPGSVPMLYELPKGCFFAPRCKHAKEICHQEDYRLPRGSAGNYRNRAVCSCHSDQPVIPYAKVTHGDAEK